MDPILRRRIIVIAVIIAAFIVAASVPFDQSVKGVCSLESPSVWYLTNSGTGEIYSGWERNLLDTQTINILFQFERPDVVELQLYGGLTDGSLVAKGDTIAILASREGIGRREILDASVSKALAEQNALRQGARTEDIEVALARIKREEVELGNRKLDLSLTKALYDSGFATLDDYQQAEGMYNLTVARLEQEKAELKALRAGARPSDIEIAEKNVEMLTESFRSGERVLGKSEAITSPLNGCMRLSGGTDPWIRIERMDTLAVYVPIPESSVPYLKVGQPVELILKADNQYFRNGLLNGIDFDNRGNIRAYARILLDNKDSFLQPGMTGRARLSIGKTTLLQGANLGF